MTVRTLAELSELCQADLVGDGAREITGPARLDAAGPTEISFLAQPQYRAQLDTTGAGAVVLGRDVDVARDDLALLRCDDPETAFNAVVMAFAPERPSPAPGVHPSAVVDPSATVAADVSIGPFCQVGPGAVLSEGCVLHAQVTIGASAQVGERGELHPGVTLYPFTRLGADCLVHAGTVIGSDGFGFRHTSEGWQKTPQMGWVVIGDRVEIGANTAIDRGRFGPTVIGSGCKLDNHVHVAHNVEIGEDCLLIAQSGISGSTRLGQGVIMAGQAGAAGHLEIGSGARIGGGSGVFQSVPAGSDWFGSPAKPRLQALRQSKELDRLCELRRRVRELEQRLSARVVPGADPANGHTGGTDQESPV